MGSRLSPIERIQQETGLPFKVCLRAAEREFERGYIEYGTSIRSGWVTAEGAARLLP